VTTLADYLRFSQSEDAKYAAAERFVDWLELRAIREARGDDYTELDVDPSGRYWLGRLGPKDFVTRLDERGDRLEPCAIGVKLRPRNPGPWKFDVSIQFAAWLRRRKEGGPLRWAWTKSSSLNLKLPLRVSADPTEQSFGIREIEQELQRLGLGELGAEIRVRVTGSPADPTIEVCLVNTSQEIQTLVDGRFFEASLSVHNLEIRPFILESLPDSFRYARDVLAFGVNCGCEIADGVIKTNDRPAASRSRPKYWAVDDPPPDLRFIALSQEPMKSAEALLGSFEAWAAREWSEARLKERASVEQWSDGMRLEAAEARKDFDDERRRVRNGLNLLKRDEMLRKAFSAMNESMAIAAKGKYESWRPFQLAFLLANLECLVAPGAESGIVDVVWFATGGGKTETYLGLLLTAAFLDRLRGKVSGVTAWSRFPLRMLSLQQTQRFANALAAGEIIRRNQHFGGDAFSLGFLVGGGATPNQIRKESERESEDADKISEMDNPFRLLEVCPFCRNKSVRTRFDRASWRLIHFCASDECPTGAEALPIFVVDHEIWRFLPTIVIGTLDKAANIARHSGMRGLLGAPWGKCSRSGHGYTYARRRASPSGCLVPDCRGGEPEPLPMEAELYAPSFRLQDELHLLRDSLGAVDAHYELALDRLQREISGQQPKILASSATLSGYQKQTEVLYRREARVFPQPAPKDGEGFWTSESNQLMRRYVSLAPRRLTVEFVVDRLIISIQQAIRSLIVDPKSVCSELAIDEGFAPFLIDTYGTNVVYGNTLQDIDAVLRSAETQYAELSPPPNIASLTGRTDFEEVRQTLERLERPEPDFNQRLHLIAASSMMSHGVDIDRLNIMIMLALPLGVAEFIQATARVGRRWPAIVFVIPKMTRERDASVYRAFPQFVTHGDRFVEPIPITRKSRRVLERTIAGLELARMVMLHEPGGGQRLVTPRDLNSYVRSHPDTLVQDRIAIQDALGIDPDDDFMIDQLKTWFQGFDRNLRQPRSDASFLADLSPTGSPMTSLRDVEEQAPVKGDSTR
jgi:Helicase conserved C-terminal domain